MGAAVLMTVPCRLNGAGSDMAAFMASQLALTAARGASVAEAKQGSPQHTRRARNLAAHAGIAGTARMQAAVRRVDDSV